MAALRDQWRGQTDPLVQGLPYQCSHEPQKQGRARFEEYYHSERAALAQVLVAKAIGARAPRVARQLLRTLYNQDLNQKSPLLEQLARELARQHDAEGILTTREPNPRRHRLGASRCSSCYPKN